MLFYTFSDILRIDHLWDFSSLSKLELNNNAIEKIQGLDHLINLTWLSKIQSLFLLTKLCVGTAILYQLRIYW